MITGAHTVIYSTNPEADRVFLRDVLKLTNVDVGDGWLIFGLWPSIRQTLTMFRSSI